MSRKIRLALDATDAAHPEPTGIGNYSRKVVEALARGEFVRRDPACELVLCIRPRPYLRRAWRRTWQPPFRTSLLLDPWVRYPIARLYHGMSHRLAKHSYPAQVVTLHDRYPLVSQDYASAAFRRLLEERIEDAIRRATRIIAVSEAVRQRLLWHDASLHRKVRVVLHGVDPPQTAPLEEIDTLREDVLGFASGERFFLNVGTIQVRKNVSNIVMALSQLPGYRLVLAGGDGYGADKIHALIRKEGLAERVRVLRYPSASQLRLLYAAASALVFPSLEEGFGLPILEAMSYGLPVITSDVAATREVAGGAALLVDPYNVDEIREAMLRAIEDEQTASELIEKGRRRAAQFTWEKCARETWAVYQEALREAT